MSPKIVKPKAGCVFALTGLGAEKGYIRVKFDEDSPLIERYQRNVPKSWLDKGYVVEVEEKINGEE